MSAPWMSEVQQSILMVVRLEEVLSISSPHVIACRFSEYGRDENAVSVTNGFARPARMLLEEFTNIFGRRFIC